MKKRTTKNLSTEGIKKRLKYQKNSAMFNEKLEESIHFGAEAKIALLNDYIDEDDAEIDLEKRNILDKLKK